MKLSDPEFYNAIMARFDSLEKRLEAYEETQSLLLKAVVKLYNSAHSH